jgi:serine O-acetyltransferase
MTVNRAIQAQLNAALWECCPPDYIRAVNQTPLLHDVTTELVEDAAAFAGKDPASCGDPLYIIQTYASFKAILHYRLAHKLDHHFTDDEPQFRHLPMYASLVSNRGKMLSGADLHFRCLIGRRFVLDHGVGTVFGETARVGDDCYILGGVTLGAAGISNNPNGKRHPTVGNRVQIGAFTRILGPVSIGDDVLIGPQCSITEDVAPLSKITLRSTLQVLREHRPRGAPLSGPLSPLSPLSPLTYGAINDEI